ncbi:hypothetical protein GOP47_0005638 [Adiantum capillus-veneris]|uniref:Gnk2-homologous domain-containing protein n=1 Tax=Adiantum capillus-veneris TaxID=13818 RepID=A0A9D4V5I0_ADICA|nr:hypothetical protein GOP47_0005638 [Adiantum capillus-veneris]
MGSYGNEGESVAAAMMVTILAAATMVMVGVGVEAGGTTEYIEFVYAKCNANGIPGGSPFWGNLGMTLHQLVENTAYADFDFKTQNGGGRCPTFGHATCDLQVLQSPEDCTSCLTYLANRIWATCNNAIGAEVKFVGCYLRYEQYRF